MENKQFSSGKEEKGDSWYVDNYILLKDYYDMTISRVAARCVRSGGIAIEEYKHYDYILDVLDEITSTGDYIVSHPDLYNYVEQKIAGGVNALKKNLKEFKFELEHNASPDLIKEDKNALKKMKEALGAIDPAEDPTNGAGMSADDVIKKLIKENNIDTSEYDQALDRNQLSNPKAPRPQAQGGYNQNPKAPHPQAQGGYNQNPKAPHPQAQGGYNQNLKAHHPQGIKPTNN